MSNQTDKNSIRNRNYMTEGQKLSPQTGTSRLKINVIFLAKNMLKCTKGSFCYRDLQI